MYTLSILFFLLLLFDKQYSLAMEEFLEMVGE